MSDALRPLAGHAVVLLLAQLALLLTVARLGAELARRLGLPAVVGELLSGVVLGPSLFGRVLPGLFAVAFPRDAAQFHLLDVVGTLGMVLLLLLTGLETDVRLLRNLGRSALVASAGGLFLPFGLGFVLGILVPDASLAAPDHRTLFCFFLATAMSISAMPVIAKILVDLDLTRRNIGLVILSAGVVDDTVGWLILSVIAGAATHGQVHVGELGATLLGLALFLAGAALLLYPALRFLVRVTGERFRTPDSDLVLVVVTALGCAAVTERIGVHAVFGAFVAGVVLHQVPRLRAEAVHKLEALVFSVLGPIFFGIVGLKVDLGALGSGGGGLLAIALTVACVGKILGAGGGALWSGMRFWEAASLAVAMNARGAMGLVVAMIGLSLGILSQQMFSIIVVVAIVTSFMAPIGLRLTMRRVRMTEEEARRIIAAGSRGAFDPARVRLLLAAGEGSGVRGAAPLVEGLSRSSENPVTVLHVDSTSTSWQRWLRALRLRGSASPSGVDAQLEALRKLGGRPVRMRRTSAHDVAGEICAEAARGYDLVLLGAPATGDIAGDLLADVVAGAPCHVAVIRAEPREDAYRHVLVPVDGSVASRVAAELAVRYAQSVGATLTLALLSERRPQAEAMSASPDATDAAPEGAPAPPVPSLDEELERISVVFRAATLRPEILRLAYDPTSSALADVLARGDHDLVVIGAENRAIRHRLFFGYENERVIRAARGAVVVVVPNLARLSAAAAEAGAIPAEARQVVAGTAASPPEPAVVGPARVPGREP